MTFKYDNPRYYRLHDTEPGVICGVGPDGTGFEIANTLNGFGDQLANARLIVDALNAAIGTEDAR